MFAFTSWFALVFTWRMPHGALTLFIAAAFVIAVLLLTTPTDRYCSSLATAPNACAKK